MAVANPLLNDTVGAAVYPVPSCSTITAVTAPPVITALALAPPPVVSPEAGVIVTVGAAAYPLPPAVTAIVVTCDGESTRSNLIVSLMSLTL